MIKRRGGSQIGNLTPDHKPFESRGQLSFDWGVLYIVEKIILRVVRYYIRISKKKLIWKRYERPKSWDSKNFSFETPTFDKKCVHLSFPNVLIIAKIWWNCKLQIICNTHLQKENVCIRVDLWWNHMLCKEGFNI
jgi:hypothetical protein